MTADVVNARGAHSCPSWCTVDPQHDAEAVDDFWEGYRFHYGVIWNEDGNFVRLACVTSPAGELDLEVEPPNLDLGDGEPLTAEYARAMASALLRAAAEIEALTA